VLDAARPLHSTIPALVADGRPGDTKFSRTDALLLLMALIWGVNYSAVKYGGHVLTPLLFTWARVLGAAITLLAAAAVQRRLTGDPWPARRDALALLGLGIIGNGLYQLCFVFGVSRTRVADAVLIVASAPAIIALISRMRGIERLRARVITGIVITIVGVAIVMVGSATHASAQQGTALGTALVSAGVLFWAVYTVAVQPYTIRVDPVQLNALTMAGGFIPLVFLTPMALGDAPLRTAPASGWWCLLYSSVVSLGIAYLFWYRGIKVLGPTRTAAYANLQPVVAILTGWILLGETPTVWQAIGTVTIIGGIFLTRA
jgi:drug/metabolite transporter (DMT)-like permease